MPTFHSGSPPPHRRRASHFHRLAVASEDLRSTHGYASRHLSSLACSIRITSPVPVTHPSPCLVVRPDDPDRSPVPVAHEPSPLSSRIPRNRRVTSSSCARAISLHAIPTSGMHSPVPVAHCTLPPIATRTDHSTFTSSSCALKPLLRTGHADPSTAPSPVPVTHYPHLPFFLARHDPTTCHQFQLRISLPPIVTTYHRLQFTSSSYARSPDPISSSPRFRRLLHSPASFTSSSCALQALSIESDTFMLRLFTHYQFQLRTAPPLVVATSAGLLQMA